MFTSPKLYCLRWNLSSPAQHLSALISSNCCPSFVTDTLLYISVYSVCFRDLALPLIFFPF